MKSAPIPGLFFFTKRGKGGAPRLACDAAVMVDDLRPACDLICVRTSRPIYRGALPRQVVRPGQFLDLSKLAPDEKSAAALPLAGAGAS